METTYSQEYGGINNVWQNKNTCFLLVYCFFMTSLKFPGNYPGTGKQ
jgi:hypothetical protein